MFNNITRLKNLFTASLSIYKNYNKYESNTILNTFDGNSYTLLILKPDIYTCNKFVLMAIKNEDIYIKAVELKKW